MEKIDRLYPSEVLGDRIESARTKANLTRREVYDLVIGADILAESKNRRIEDWEKRRTYPSYDDLVKICTCLNCDADYLLGRIDEPTHVQHDICKETGLSESAVNCLGLKWQVTNGNRTLSIPDVFSMMLENPTILTALINIINITLNDEEYVSVSVAENYDYAKTSDYDYRVKPPKSGLRRMYFEEIITELNNTLDQKKSS